MKKAFLFIIFFIGCSDNTKVVLTTISPLYSITSFLLKDQIEVNTLLPQGASPHTYEPRPKEAMDIEQSKLIIAIGGGLEPWIDALFKNKQKSNILYLFDSLKKYNKIPAYSKNPHIWLDPSIMKDIVDIIYNNLSKSNIVKDKKLLKVRYNQLLDSLTSLDEEIDSMLTPVKKTRVIVFHPAFAYFFNHYDIIISGVIIKSPGAMPMPKDIEDIEKNIKKFHINAIFSELQSPSDAAKTISNATNTPLYQLDPIGNKKISYFTLIRNNARIIKAALTQ